MTKLRKSRPTCVDTVAMSSTLHISQGIFRLSDQLTLSLPECSIRQGESWAVVGANGSGKSALGMALSGELILLSGQRCNSFNSIARISFEQLQHLLDKEWRQNNSDLLAEDELEIGSDTATIIQQENRDPVRCRQLARQFAIEPLLSRKFKHLSSGESRKALLCRALMLQPDLLILDEPFESLDSDSRQQLTEMLALLAAQGLTLVLILNRFDEIPDFILCQNLLPGAAMHQRTVGDNA